MKFRVCDLSEFEKVDTNVLLIEGHIENGIDGVHFVIDRITRKGNGRRLDEL